MKKKIVALLLTLVMLVGIIPAAVYAAEEAETKVTLEVVADKATAMPGDEITYTVTMKTEYTLTSMGFITNFPEGLTYVDGSGELNPDAKAALGCDDFAWVEWTERVGMGAQKGENKFQAFASSPKHVSEIVLCTFKAKVDDDAALTDGYEVALVELVEFMDADWVPMVAEEIEVIVTAITVVDHVCADNLTEVAGKEPTCTEDGAKAHFVCSECGKKYADDSASAEFEGDTIIAPTGHGEGSWAEVTAPTCTEAGLKELRCDCGDLLDTEEIPAEGHDEGKWSVVKEAECEVDGSKVLNCTKCDAELDTEVIPATGHDEGALVVVKEATCEDKGISELRCTACNALLDTVETPAHGHDDGEWVVVSEGDCVTQGLKELRCTVCGSALDSKVTPPVGSHDYKAVVTDPTATTGGYTTYTCSRCGDSYVGDFTDKIEGKVVLTVANGNNTILTGIVNSDYSASVSVPKGVTIDTNAITAGLTMTDVASLGINGTKSFEKVIATGVDKLVDFDRYIPTTFTNATIGGMIDGVAYSYAFEAVNTAEAFTINATPDAGVQPAWHALTSHIATAEKSADDSYVLVPNAAYVQIGTEKLVFEDDADDFKLDNISGATADELRAAVKLLEVEALEDAQIEIFLPAGTVLALSNYEATLEDDATITIYGYKDSEAVNTIMSQLRACETTTDIIKTLVLFVGDVATAINGQDVTLNIEFDHIADDEWVVVEEATCTEAGLQVKYCVMCGEVAAEEVLPVIGHTAVVDAAVEATCTETGLTEGSHCDVCGEVLVAQEIVEKIGHDYVAVVTDPTCTDKGYTTYTCANCGDEYVADYVDALGHDYAAVVTAPTCTDKGYTTYTCAVCGDEYVDDYVDALGHDYKAVVTEPTCTEAGYTTCTCTVCGDEHVTEYAEATGHTPAAEYVRDAEVAGKYNLFCTVCDALIDSYTKELPAGITLDQSEVTTKYVRKAPAFTLTETVTPADCDIYTVVWTSSNEKVATVDEDGNVTTHHFGDAVITATLLDAEGNVVDTASCDVNVYYTFCQWLIWFFLLGCTWYFV